MKKPIMRLLLATSLVWGALSSSLSSQDTLRTWSFETLGRGRPQWIEDLDGDGFRDLLIGWNFFSPPGMPDVGRLRVVSGLTSAIIREHVGTLPNTHLGGFIQVLGDVDDDGFSDYATLKNDSAGVRVVLVFGGADGKVLFEGAPFTDHIAPAGDVSGDGVADFVAARELGYSLFLGGDFERRYFAFNPGGPVYFGQDVVVFGDVDGDGFSDIAIGAPGDDKPINSGPGRVYVYSGASGTLLYDLFRPEEYIFSLFGQALTSPGDLSGDGIPDLAIGAQDGGPNAFGRVHLYDSVTSLPLGAIDPPAPKDFGRQLESAGDVDGNGYGDLLVYYRSPVTSSVCQLVDGGTKEVLYEMPYDNVTGFLGRGADWNEDDFPDFLLRNDDFDLVLYSGAPPGVSAGPACVSRGESPRIGATGSARVGGTMRIHLTRVAPGVDARLVVGSPVRRPTARRGPGGPPGCLPLVAPIASYPVTTDALRPGQGVGTVELPIPADPSLVGSAFHVQWWIYSQPPDAGLVAATRVLSIETLEP